VGALQEFVYNFTYLGIFVVLLLGSLGVPIPEEMPIIAAAVLSHEGIVRWWCVLPVCLLGVLSGDMVLYWVGRHWGEQVFNWRLVRLVLSAAREQWLKAAYRRHALKTVVMVRHSWDSRRRVSHRGQCERPVLEVRGGGHGCCVIQRPVGVRVSLLLYESDPSHHGRCASGRALARSRWPPSARGCWSSACGDGIVASGRSDRHERRSPTGLEATEQSPHRRCELRSCRRDRSRHRPAPRG
jgi:hypothetical protein